MNMKFILFSVFELLTNFQCSTTSVPVIVDTHTEKKNDSWATILWDNISAELDQNPFPEDLKIDGSKLIDVFSKIFQRIQAENYLSEIRNFC